MAHASILGAIGDTPAVWLDRIVAESGVDGRILAKLDYLNPGFSKKDRAALGAHPVEPDPSMIYWPSFLNNAGASV